MSFGARMATGLSRWGTSWRRERACGRGGIRKNCGNLWKSFKSPIFRTARKVGRLSEAVFYLSPAGGPATCCEFFSRRKVSRMDFIFFSPHLCVIITRDDRTIEFHAPRQASVKYLSMSEYIIALRKRPICVDVSLGVFNSARNSRDMS